MTLLGARHWRRSNLRRSAAHAVLQPAKARHWSGALPAKTQASIDGLENAMTTYTSMSVANALWPAKTLNAAYRVFPSSFQAVGGSS